MMEQYLQKNKEYKDIDEHIRNHFYYLRISAEKLARSNYCDNFINDITLAQIYEIIGACGLLSEEQLERIKALEIKVELENIIGISSNIEEVRSLIEAGNKVVLISDMYLGEEIIRKMLIKADAVFKAIPIYVSSDYSKTKESGKLYELVAEKENKGFYKQWVHRGDNLDADILSAASYGIQAEHYQFEELQPYEKQLVYSSENNVTVQLLIGTARNGRIFYTENKLEIKAVLDKKAFEIGSSIGAPVLLPYIIWILKQCEKKGIRRLYFVARDGYVLKKIADRVIELNKQDIKTSYFYGSRKALRMPSIDTINDDLGRIIKNSSIHMIHSLEEIADLFEVPLAVLRCYLPKYEKLEKKILTTSAVEAIIGILSEDIHFGQQVYEIQREKRKLLVSYIKQEVGVIDHTVAFVELFGSGLTQECLAKICKDISNEPIQSFFFNKVRLSKKEFGISYVYMPIDEPLAYIVEELCRAPHGQTIGYKDEDGTIVPVLGADEQAALERHGYNRYIDGVMQFVDLYNGVLNYNINVDEHIPFYLQYLKYITQTPDEETLNYFGEMPFNHTGRDREEALFAPKLSREQLQQIFLTRYNEPIEMYYKGSSLEYSLLRCSEEEKELVLQYKRKNRENNWNRTPNSCPGIDAGWGENHTFADEYNLIEKNIILYAAGKRGQLLHSQLMHRPEYNILAWIDTNYEKYQAQKLDIQNPAVIRELEYDQVVIGVLDKKVVDEIITVLLELGVPKKKILWIKPRPRL
ncbi:hypothetical protein [Anaerocolumna xylanovorans]|nr:hypothetical protein [Anaerocolumna xylanovorans]